ncbi:MULTISPECIES: hypothetical protein [unclassified Pseudomonas]|uniref:hypothetical protein n=1 Tax=unclassified Pseudomonas TaxID=196821 RepID=UPI0012698476|nr:MULTISPECIES: hypothetical protein [unclassified Pseudomonas]
MADNQYYPILMGAPDLADVPLTADEVHAIDALLLCRQKRIRLLSKERDQRAQADLYRQLQFFTSRLPPELANLEPIEFYVPSPSSADEQASLLSAFWAAVRVLQAQGLQINHARGRGLLAINLPQFRQIISASPYKLQLDRDLCRALRASVDPLFIEVKKVNSVVTRETVHCWIFQALDGWQE